MVVWRDSNGSSRLYGRGWGAGRIVFSIQTHYNVKLGTEVVAMHIKLMTSL